jgi:hypothetical protein
MSESGYQEIRVQDIGGPGNKVRQMNRIFEPDPLMD